MDFVLVSLYGNSNFIKMIELLSHSNIGAPIPTKDAYRAIKRAVNNLPSIDKTHTR